MRIGLVLWLILLGLPADAQENSELDRIPDAVREMPAEQANGDSTPLAQGRYFAEDALSDGSRRRNLVVGSAPETSQWMNRTSADATKQWALTEGFAFNFSDRLDLSEGDRIRFPEQAARNNLREAYVTWEPMPETYLEFGRINLRNGIALGFNPTDFFRARTAVNQASADPSALRENRLGTVMLRAQYFWSGGSATIAYAPKLHNPRPLFNPEPHWLDPLFDKTNTVDGFSGSVNFDVSDVSAQILAFGAKDRTKIGVDLSHAIGDSVIAYAEWAGGSERNLTARAIEFARDTAASPRGVTPLPGVDASRTFLNDLSIGASWTNTGRVTLNIEYHWHQGGFSDPDWRNWFNTGALNTTLGSYLWYLRAYAFDQQEPVSRHQIFVHGSWSDGIVTHLELSGFALINPVDGSAILQLGAIYNLSKVWTVGVYLNRSVGRARSEWGSLPQSGGLVLQAIRYF